MYKNNFVCAIKLNNNILKEEGDKVKLPFGSEYKVYLKNLNNRKALVNIYIDGETVLGENSIVMSPDSFLELKGFIEDKEVRNAFKFIKRIKEIEDYRGINVEDGLVRIEVTFEEEQPKGIIHHWEWDHSYPYWQVIPGLVIYSNSDEYTYIPGKLDNGTGHYNIYYNSAGNSGTYTGEIRSMPGKIGGWAISTEDVAKYSVNPASVNVNGITVPGNPMKQQFYAGNIGKLEENITIFAFNLVGYDEENKPNEPIFTREKITCNYCGKKNKQINNFCSRCGAFLKKE